MCGTGFVARFRPQSPYCNGGRTRPSWPRPAARPWRGVIALHTRGVPDVSERMEAIRYSAAAWASFWDRHLDLYALAFDVTEHLSDMAEANAGSNGPRRKQQRYWIRLYGADELLLFVGLNPSTWSSGTCRSPAGRSPTKGRQCCGWRSSRPGSRPVGKTRSSPASTTG
jgi:hypothetical protein